MIAVAVLETGTGENSFRYESRPAEGRSVIALKVNANLRASNGTDLAWKGIIFLLLALGHLSVPVNFGVVASLGTMCLLGTPFKDLPVKTIHPIDRYIRLCQSRIVRIVPDTKSTQFAPCTQPNIQ